MEMEDAALTAHNFHLVITMDGNMELLLQPWSKNPVQPVPAMLCSPSTDRLQNFARYNSLYYFMTLLQCPGCFCCVLCTTKSIFNLTIMLHCTVANSTDRSDCHRPLEGSMTLVLIFKC